MKPFLAKTDKSKRFSKTNENVDIMYQGYESLDSDISFRNFNSHLL